MIHGKTSHPLASFPQLSTTKRADEPDDKTLRWLAMPTMVRQHCRTVEGKSQVEPSEMRCVGFHSDMAEKLKIQNVGYLSSIVRALVL